jgi:hypothetical protein
MDDYKKEILESLENHKGIVTSACASIGCPRSTYYNYYNTDPEFKIAVDDIQDIAIDFVESKLMEKINGITMLDKEKDGETITYTLPPSDTAIIFYLKTKGKKRGYIEKTELDISGALNLANEPVIFK